MNVNGVMNFTGSKFKLLDQILPEMDYSKKYFIDLFCGSFVVGSNVVDKYDDIIGNDIIEDIVKIHENLIKGDYISFISGVKKLSVSKEDQDGFNQLRESYNTNKSPDKLYALMLCSTNNMLRFNQKYKYNQTFGKRTFNSSTEKKLNEYIDHIVPYKDKISFTSKHFSEVEVSSSSMVYIDSPYTGSEAGYNAYWKKDDDNKLYNYCNNLNRDGHSFMVSGIIGEHKPGKRWELMDKLISDGYNFKILDFGYEKVARNKNSKNSKEIIIMNYSSSSE